MKGEIIMAYTKKTWVKGNTPLSAENFNHMEQGIADAHTDIAQLNSDKAWKRIFDGKISESFIIPSKYREIVIQITIGYTNSTDITLPEIYINDLNTWWNKITSYRYNDAYNACILMNYNSGNKQLRMNETWFVCNPSSDNISYIVYGRQ
jgi:hypothetical protein